MINKHKKKILIILILVIFFILPVFAFSQSVNVKNLQEIQLKMYKPKGLVWKGKSTQINTWDKITETPDGKIWFAGGDHWGTDKITGFYHNQPSVHYKRPWGYGNTSVCYYDPKTDSVSLAFLMDKPSGIFSNEHTPGIGKIHSNILSDSRGNIYVIGYLGASYAHEFDDAYYPRSFQGGALLKYDPKNGDFTNYGIPTPYGGVVAIYHDTKRHIINGLSIGRERFWRLNLKTRKLHRYDAGMGQREMIMDNNGYCYFNNAIGGLTKFNPNTQKFSDVNVTLPSKVNDPEAKTFRASVVSPNNIIYGITRYGFVFRFNPKTQKLKNLGHVLGTPGKKIYTPNIALDAKWHRLYFIAGNHSLGLNGHHAILTVLDLKTGKFHWVGEIAGVSGCFGALVARDHTVYFNSYGHFIKKNGDIERYPNGKPIPRPFLVKYTPPKNINLLKQNLKVYKKK